ncbi:interleukin-13 [Rhynchonycteris naso]
MALWLTMVVVLTCFGGLASPSPVVSLRGFRELIEELNNITQTSLCNGSMVWNVNLTAGSYCAALDSLMNISDCHAIQKTQRMLSTLCRHKSSARPLRVLVGHPCSGVAPLTNTLALLSLQQVSSQPVQDTKVEVLQFAKDLLQQLKKIYRHYNS